MAETPDGQERSERPTAKRVRDAREKGQVPRSRELTTLAALLTAAVGFMATGDLMLQGMGDVMRRNFTLSRADLVETVAEYFDDEQNTVSMEYLLSKADVQ